MNAEVHAPRRVPVEADGPLDLHAGAVTATDGVWAACPVGSRSRDDTVLP